MPAGGRGTSAREPRHGRNGVRRERPRRCYRGGVRVGADAHCCTTTITATVAVQRTEECFIVLTWATPTRVASPAVASLVSPGRTTRRVRMRHRGFDAVSAPPAGWPQGPPTPLQRARRVVHQCQGPPSSLGSPACFSASATSGRTSDDPGLAARRRTCRGVVAEAGARLTGQQLAADWREVRCEMPSTPRHRRLR